MMDQLPAGDSERAKLADHFRKMAARVLHLQKPDGYWPSSLLSSGDATAESSGTALFTYSLAWGINSGLLPRAEYESAVRLGWQALDAAIQPDGRLGWVQGAGDRPARAVAEGSQIYAIGAYLLAATAVSDLVIHAQHDEPARKSSEPAAKTSQTGPPAPDTSTPSQVSMMGVGLRVSDLERAIRFYTEGLGLKPLQRFSSTDMNEVVMGFGASGAAPQVFLLRRKDGVKEELSDAELRKDKIMLAVGDVALVSARLKAAGYTPGSITEDAGSGAKVFWISDPDGHRLEIITLPGSSRR